VPCSLSHTGELHDRELQLPGGGFTVGDRVVVKRNELQLGVNDGDRGRVLAVDPDQQRPLLACEGRTVEFGVDVLHVRTEHGDPTLMHGCAIACHVARGLTVGKAFVLADRGLSRDVGYTALSRGRRPSSSTPRTGPTTSTPRSAR
jgi:ATP-dependent exoDNAse (exonuclease V) alpha subunit